VFALHSIPFHSIPFDASVPRLRKNPKGEIVDHGKGVNLENVD
jgi:hypothetical protein